VAIVVILAVAAVVVYNVHAQQRAAQIAANAPQEVTLTIPEGLTAEQTAEKVQDACGISTSDFMARVNSASDYVADYPFLSGVYNNSLEGFLYPDTYYVYDNATADDVIRKMLDQFQQETSGLDLSYAASKNLTEYDVVTMASIVEKECMYDDERANVASVIYNRLHDGMRLQSDATVVYALGDSYTGNGVVTYDQIQVQSPYNTYLIDGLPPGPICSPQIASIKAAAQPASTSYLYFVTGDTQGHLTFCTTDDEFEAAKAKYNEMYGVQ
jgi:UPF0755 protein